MRLFLILFFLIISKVCLSQIVVSVPDSQRLDLGSLPHAFGYTSTNLTSDTVQSLNSQRVLTYYVQTYSYSGEDITALSQWTNNGPVSTKKHKRN
jgi:hypothetical protein